MKGRFFESDFQEAQNNFEWIKNLTTTLQTRIPYEGRWEGPGPAPDLPGSIADAKVRVAIALGLVPSEALDTLAFEETGFLPEDALALRIRERLVGDIVALDIIGDRQKTASKAVAAAADTQTEIVDPVSLRGKLPEGFPGKTALAAAEPPIHTYAQARKVKDFTTIPGIAEPTAAKIREALGATSAEEDEAE